MRINQQGMVVGQAMDSGKGGQAARFPQIKVEIAFSFAGPRGE
jgi:hypothetical protein